MSCPVEGGNVSIAYSDHIPAPTDADRLFEEAVHRGARLAATVRDLAAWDVQKIVEPLTGDELVATVVALACMVPTDQTPRELLAWYDEATCPPPTWTPEAARRAHNAWNRGERGDELLAGERAYQAAVKRRRRAAARAKQRGAP